MGRRGSTSRFLLGRLFALVITLLVASVIIFGSLFLAPGNPATLIAGGHATPGLIASIDKQYHLNDPFPVRYWHWLVGVLHGNLGQSFAYHQSVSSLLGSRIGPTLFLIAYASVIILVFGIGLGVSAGLRRRLGNAITFVTSIGLATPSFVAAIGLVALFASVVHWFPVEGSGSGFLDQLHHMTLPAVALALSWTAWVAQLTKTAVRQQLDSEHVDTARSRGLRESLVVRRHVVRNAMIPITTVSGLTVAGLVAGDVVVEQAFGIGGIGSFLIQAVTQKDFAVVQAIALLMVLIFVVVNTGVDLINSLLDPRIRQGQGT
jgi:peptide/nickel transport system permease protein